MEIFLKHLFVFLDWIFRENEEEKKAREEIDAFRVECSKLYFASSEMSADVLNVMLSKAKLLHQKEIEEKDRGLFNFIYSEGDSQWSDYIKVIEKELVRRSQL